MVGPASAGPNHPVSFGLSTHLFHGERLGRAHLDLIKAHGFDSLEVFATRTHFDYHDPAACDALAAWLDATGLRLHALHAPIVEGYARGAWGAAISNATADAVRRVFALKETETALKVASRVPYDVLVVHLGQPDDQQPPPNDNQRDAVRRSLEVLDALAGAHGVTLALEIIPNALSHAQRLVDLIDDLELEHSGICLDFGHANLVDDVVDAIEVTAGHLVTTHVHDNRGRADDHLVPFEGRIDWDTALFTMRKIGYEGTWMFELSNPGDAGEVLRKAQRACARFREILVS